MDILIRICIYVFFFVFGAFCVHRNILPRSLANKLLWWLFYVGLPLSVFYAITSTRFSPELLVLPFLAITIASIEGIASIIVGKILRLPAKITGVVVASTMIMNTSLSMPFFVAFYGTQGLAVLSLFDLGNILMVFTVTYFVTLRFGGKKLSSQELIHRIISSPSLWVICVSIILMFSGFTLPQFLHAPFSMITFGLFVLVMFTLGLLFEFNKSHIRVVAVAIGLRYILGFILGLGLVSLLHLEGIARMAVIVGATSANGYTSLVYAKIAKLDTQFAGQVVSLSLGIGIVLIPLLLYLIH